MTICLHTQKVRLGVRTDCTCGERSRAANAHMYRHFRVIVAPLRRGEACGETCALLYTYSAEWVRKCTLTGAVAKCHPVTHGRTRRRGQPCVDNPHAVAPDRWERVLRVHADPPRRKPRAANRVQLRLPRRIVSQYGQRGVQCGAV
jgi:hypothetical protein